MSSWAAGVPTADEIVSTSRWACASRSSSRLARSSWRVRPSAAAGPSAIVRASSAPRAAGSGCSSVTSARAAALSAVRDHGYRQVDQTAYGRAGCRRELRDVRSRFLGSEERGHVTAGAEARTGSGEQDDEGPFLFCAIKSTQERVRGGSPDGLGGPDGGQGVAPFGVTETAQVGGAELGHDDVDVAASGRRGRCELLDEGEGPVASGGRGDDAHTAG